MTGPRRKPGGMGPFIEGYRAWLAERGYTPGTIVNMLAMAGVLGRWMDARGIAPGDLDWAAIMEFRDAMRAAGRRCVPGAHGLDSLLEYLQGQGVLGGPSLPAAPAEVLAERYRQWLVNGRGLAEATVVRYVKLARLFLGQRPIGRGGLDSLSGADVVAFLLAESQRLSIGSVKGRVGEVRSLLRFLYLQGLTPRPLAAVVPPVAGWRDTGVPKAVPAGDVQRLLDSCDRGDPLGIRDYAMLMLIARLGLRSAEVARLELGDIDWRAGQITLRGKAGQQDGMPLPCDVGEALAAYLSQARPAAPLRQVFLAAKAPMRAIPPGLVSDVTHRACDRAGRPRIGAHRLRHTLATEMLRRGATIVEVSQVLRHRDLATTAIYAKVDFAALRTVAQPWPRGGTMTALADAARDYLRLRNSLGHELAEYHRQLPRFVAFLEAEGLPTVTVAAALAWAHGPDVDPATSIAPRRLTIARGFARYLAGIDARTEVPPPGLIAGRRRWRPPFIYCPGDIEALMAQALQLRPMPAATHETLIGVLAATGLRIGEAIRLDRADIDWASAVLTIRESKFGKTRMVPVLGSTISRLDHYARTRDRLCPQTATASFFVSTAGTRLIYACVGQVFRRLRDRAGIGAGADHPPRIHDLRHTFAVTTLLGWYRAGDDVEARLPVLSTYLGHRDPRSTYWYLSAAPELLALAAARLERSPQVTS